MEPVSPATLVDVDRYPMENLDSHSGTGFLASCRSELREQSICVLEGFVKPHALAGMMKETRALIPQGYYFDKPRTSYEGNDHVDRNWPSGHPRTVEHINRYRQVLNYQIPNDSLVRSVFHWPALTEFVRRVLGFDTLYTSACPHLALTLQIAQEGDSNGWHFDSNNGNITLLIQEPDSGGEFEYVPGLREDHDEHYDDVRAVFKAPRRHTRRTDIRPGTLVLFNGKYALHRVTPVGTHETAPDHRDLQLRQASGQALLPGLHRHGAQLQAGRGSGIYPATVKRKNLNSAQAGNTWPWPS